MRIAGLAALLLLQDVDRHVDEKIGDEKPAPACSDSEFLRRASLDLTGVLPRIEETRAYLESPDRAKLVDRLLASEEFNVWWARFLLDLTTERRAARYDTHNGRALADWFSAQLKSGRGCDAIVTDLIVASGNMEEVPQVNFLLRYSVRPSDVTGAIGRAFLGLKLQCAQCHDHPFAGFKREDFWGVAAYLARTKRYAVEDAEVLGVTDVRRGAMRMPDEDDGNPEKPGVVVPPRWLGAREAAPKADRADLARRVVSDPRFARSLVNRVWARLMGYGLVEPLDGFAEAEPSHPGLLAALAEHFEKSRFDLRALIRTVVGSRAYQRAAAPGTGHPRKFARAAVRPLTSEQILYSIVRATRWNLDEDLPGEEDLDYADYYPPELLGASPRSIRRALALLNHGDIQGAVDSGARFVMKVHGRPVRAAHFEHLFLALLCRLPTDEERKLFEGKTGRADLEDALWAILNSVEFRTNH